MTNFENMELDELKDYAKSLGITFGKIGKDKLIEKIKEKESENATVMSVIDDDDLDLWVEGYNAYHDLGHNGIMDKRKDDLIELNAHPRKK